MADAEALEVRVNRGVEDERVGSAVPDGVHEADQAARAERADPGQAVALKPGRPRDGEGVRVRATGAERLAVQEGQGRVVDREPDLQLGFHGVNVTRVTGSGHLPASRVRCACERCGRAVDAVAVSLAGQCPPSRTAFSVGAVIVGADGRELSRGFSREGGDLAVHAEEAALGKVSPGEPRLPGATMYSTLEPCSQRKSRSRTCTQLIIAAGLRRVVFAWREPALFVADARGYELLSAPGSR